MDELQWGGLWSPSASKVPPKAQVLSFMPHTPMLKVLGFGFFSPVVLFIGALL